MKTETLIRCALEEEKPELVLKNARIVNVFTQEILSGDVAVSGGLIVGVGQYSGQQEVDLQGQTVLPGWINAHVHVESSMISPVAYAEEELRQGVTTIITDPHEIVNVGGKTALRMILDCAEKARLNYYVMIPSCVPATPFEHAGAVMNAEDMEAFLSHPKVLGLAEMMNAPGVLGQDEQVMKKLKLFAGKPIDGHFPGGSGKALQAYAGAGIGTDHESTDYPEALEKMRSGMGVLIREGSACQNAEAILKGVIREGVDTSSLAFCTDDKHVAGIRQEGTIRVHLRKAVALGMDPAEAVCLATLHPARMYGLHRLGAVAPGYRADLTIVKDLQDFEVTRVMKDGVWLEDLPAAPAETFDPCLLSTVHTAPLTAEDLQAPVGKVCHVIGLVPGQILTEHLTMTPEELQAGRASGEILLAAVSERHHATGNVGVGYVKGYGLRHGAVATTVAHDSHNLLLIGDNPKDMLTAAKEAARIGGGYVLAQDGAVVEALPLPLGGLMSLQPADSFMEKLQSIRERAYAMGVSPLIDPFTTLSFIALPVIPALRLTDCGLFDAEHFCFLQE